jgi:hypothetical protein
MAVIAGLEQNAAGGEARTLAEGRRRARVIWAAYGIDRVALHADLMLLARFSLASCQCAGYSARGLAPL